MTSNIFAFLIWGVSLGSVLYFFLAAKSKKDGEKHINTVLKANEERFERLMAENKQKQKEEADRLSREKDDLLARQKRLEDTEVKIAEKEDRLEQKISELDKKYTALQQKGTELEREREQNEVIRKELQGKLSEMAGLTSEQAKEYLFKETETIYEKDFLGLIEKKKGELRAREKELSKEILIKSIQQYSAEVTAETTQTIVKLESDDIKGKLIGKEGRNIIAFERSTGVSLIIDDTPDTVFISSFDLFRRYIAKKTLEQLIEDKRIQPARIEEIAEYNRQEAEKLIYELWEKTINEMGVTGIPGEIIPLIGKFRFRTSYGQNILTHSKEVAYIAEAIAKQIGADPVVALKGGLLHDLGKAMDHDIEGTHPEIGGRIARKYGLPENIVNIIEGHHDDVPQICIETKIVQIADAISAIRPGARRANADEYIKRIQEIENIAMSFSGVSKAYALSAGREVRVFVDCDTISDLAAEKMAREIAESFEANLNYPGEIKVNLIREKRIVEYAR